MAEGVDEGVGVAVRLGVTPGSIVAVAVSVGVGVSVGAGAMAVW